MIEVRFTVLGKHIEQLCEIEMAVLPRPSDKIMLLNNWYEVKEVKFLGAEMVLINIVKI